MNLERLLKVLHESVELSSAEDLKSACEFIIRVQAMNGGERDVIRASFKKGPLFDGDVPSKPARDQLVRDGFIAKVVVKGEEGFNACTYKGARAYRLIDAGAFAMNRASGSICRYCDTKSVNECGRVMGTCTFLDRCAEDAIDS